MPKLNAFTLKEIGNVTGLSLTVCSRVRAGGKVPRSRHWEALLRLVDDAAGRLARKFCQLAKQKHQALPPQEQCE